MSDPLLDLPLEGICEICRRYRVRELAIFGSALREDFGPNSDIDLLVEFEPDARIGFIELGEIEQELEALLGRPVELVPKSGLRPLLREEVLTNARVLCAS